MEVTTLRDITHPGGGQALVERAPVNRNSSPKSLRSITHGPRMDWRGNQLAKTEDMGVLMKTLDVLARPQYATVAGYKAITTGKPLFDEIAQGWKGQTKGSWIDVVEELIPGRHPWVEKPIGFVGDVVVDPINLIPMSWFGGVAKLLGIPKMMGIVGDIPAVSRQMKRFIPGWDLRKINVTKDLESGKVIHDTLIAEAALKAGTARKQNAYELYRDMQLQLNFIRRNVQVEMKEKWDIFRKVAQKAGKNPDEAAADLIRLREAGLASEVPAEFKPFYDDIVKGLDRLKAREIEAGILDPKNVKENYFPHIYEKGSVEWVDGVPTVKEHKGFFTKLKYRHAPFFTRPREFKNLEEAKRVMADWSKGGAVDEIAPVENWFRGYAIRRFIGESSVGWKNFTVQTLEDFGTALPDLLKMTDEGLAAKLKLAQDPSKIVLDLMSGKPVAQTVDTISELLKQGKFTLPKGISLVTATTNFKAPAMKKMFLGELQKTLRSVEDAKVLDNLKDIDFDQGDVLSQIFQKSGGRGIVELNLEQVEALNKAGAGKLIYALPTEYAKEIKDTFKVFSTDESTKGFIRTLDSATHMWKSMATSMRWPFHMRNAISNTWLMYLGGVDAHGIPKKIAQAMDAQVTNHLARKGSEKALGKKVVAGMNSKQLMNLADRYGVRAYGWMGGDMPTKLQSELSIIEKTPELLRKIGVGDQPLNPFQTAARLGRRVGTAVEDNARLATFIDQLERKGIQMEPGMKWSQFLEKNRRGIEESAMHVKKYLFDYTELTDFERKVMKRIFPFYTWMRKNIPLQLQSVALQPQKYARLGDFQRAFFPDTAKAPTEAEIMKHHWMGEDGFRRTPWQTKDGSPVYYKLDLPTEELNKMWKMSTWLSALTPIVGMGAIAANVRMWPETGKLSEPGAKGRAPWYFQFAPEWLHKYASIEPIMNRQTGKVELGMDPQWKYALKTAFPFLNDWERAFPNAGSLVSESDQGKYSMLSYASGIKFRPFEIQKEAMSAGFKRAKAKRLVRKAVRKRPTLTAEEAQEIFKKSLK